MNIGNPANEANVTLYQTNVKLYSACGPEMDLRILPSEPNVNLYGLCRTIGTMGKSASQRVWSSVQSSAETQDPRSSCVNL